MSGPPYAVVWSAPATRAIGRRRGPRPLTVIDFRMPPFAVPPVSGYGCYRYREV